MTYDVVIPAFNASETILDALRSVFEQSVPPANVIVVDDGSTDDTADLVHREFPQVTLYSQDNHGCGHATSAGYRLTRTPLVASLDADDIWLAHKMERQLEYLDTHPETALVFSLQRQFQHKQPDATDGKIREGLNRSSMVIRRQVFDTIGDIIDPPGGRGDLIDWLARAREAGFSTHTIDQVLCLRRIIPGSLSFGRDREKDKGYLLVAYRAMQRRKKALEQGQD
ncbi:MAG TPA: glycosyltransferase family 2 protein [Aliiroseovarius sp.]|nr:glycosyltransferase family 2 protein [Aliiroseovarius sp.]